MIFIELLPGNRVKMLVTPNFNWIPRGPIQRYFEESVVKDFFDSAFDGVGETRQFVYGMLSEHSIAQINRRVQHLIEDYKSLLNQDWTVEMRLCS